MPRISEKESLRRRIARVVLREAWKLVRQAMGYCWFTVLRLAWKVVRSKTRLHYSKAVGVSASGTTRQGRLQRLLQYPPERVSLMLMREPNNCYDSNAVRVVGCVDGVNGFTLGYLKASLAAQVSPLLDAGHSAVALMERITGTGDKGLYGLNFRFAIL
jgi:hypothetical protein